TTSVMNPLVGADCRIHQACRSCRGWNSFRSQSSSWAWSSVSMHCLNAANPFSVGLVFSSLLSAVRLDRGEHVLAHLQDPGDGQARLHRVERLQQAEQLRGDVPFRIGERAHSLEVHVDLYE